MAEVRVNEILHELLEVVLGDLRRSDGPRPLVRDHSWLPHPRAESAMLEDDDGSGVGVWVELDRGPADRLAHLADQVQEWVLWDLGAARGLSTWPDCPGPGHSHPLEAGVLDGVAVWHCPHGDVRVPIGTVGVAPA